MGDKFNVTVNPPGTTTLETGTSVSIGSFYAIQVIADAVFTTLTGMGGDAVAGITFPAGTILYGAFTAVTLASGKIVLYS